ncbi:hypothetical protein Cri9333_3687 [Crinalium epipsammum PCC 9333]|uniref:Uncharacterized protein n=1 Tax=Crinalium epipsammum PCC 9333 TaxID=1173022 RepID=K9W4X5_9CYAN|nr:DUF6658 family protein [Crinalium epipsammum]AFZ14500.1 hypothetical protein Cri9333_3687 [Crinalium epipsammum PCC 9333]
MNKVTNWFKNLRLGKVITVFLSAMILFVTTACGGGGVMAKTADVVRPEVPGGAVTSKHQGGMNDFSDVDPRKDTSEAAAKAKGLIDNAESNVIDQTGSVGENTKRILDKKGENARDFNKNIDRSTDKAQDKAQGTLEDFAKGTKKGTENIKENTGNAVEGASKDAPDAVNKGLNAAKKGLDKVSNAGKEVGQNAQALDTAEDGSSAIHNKVKTNGR